ncbi:hypothetical protein [Endozoicomonas sp. ALB115]|uniref:hypothetical protein n=2 Tax=unclassified Endozoicomonas TaxID=2644528 RepID=UPI003BB4C6C6
MVKAKKKAASDYKALLVALTVLLISGCSQMKYYNFVVHNDSESDIYNIEVISNKEESLYPGHPGSYAFLEKGHAGGTVSLPMESVPDLVHIQWKNHKNGSLFKKIINLKELLPNHFLGDVFFSITGKDNIFLSWVQTKSNYRSLDCGGYIFEKYYYRAKPKIDKNIADWQSYLKQKEADLKAGLTDKYKKPKYYDQVTEADFRCNDLLYLKP